MTSWVYDQYSQADDIPLRPPYSPPPDDPPIHGTIYESTEGGASFEIAEGPAQTDVKIEEMYNHTEKVDRLAWDRIIKNPALAPVLPDLFLLVARLLSTKIGESIVWGHVFQAWAQQFYLRDRSAPAILFAHNLLYIIGARDVAVDTLIALADKWLQVLHNPPMNSAGESISPSTLSVKSVTTLSAAANDALWAIPACVMAAHLLQYSTETARAIAGSCMRLYPCGGMYPHIIGILVAPSTTDRGWVRDVEESQTAISPDAVPLGVFAYTRHSANTIAQRWPTDPKTVVGRVKTGLVQEPIGYFVPNPVETPNLGTSVGIVVDKSKQPAQSVPQTLSVVTESPSKLARLYANFLIRLVNSVSKSRSRGQAENDADISGVASATITDVITHVRSESESSVELDESRVVGLLQWPIQMLMWSGFTYNAATDVWTANRNPYNKETPITAEAVVEALFHETRRHWLSDFPTRTSEVNPNQQMGLYAASCLDALIPNDANKQVAYGDIVHPYAHSLDLVVNNALVGQQNTMAGVSINPVPIQSEMQYWSQADKRLPNRELATRKMILNANTRLFHTPWVWLINEPLRAGPDVGGETAVVNCLFTNSRTVSYTISPKDNTIDVIGYGTNVTFDQERTCDWSASTTNLRGITYTTGLPYFLINAANWSTDNGSYSLTVAGFLNKLRQRTPDLPQSSPFTASARIPCVTMLAPLLPGDELFVSYGLEEREGYTSGWPLPIRDEAMGKSTLELLGLAPWFPFEKARMAEVVMDKATGKEVHSEKREFTFPTSKVAGEALRAYLTFPIGLPVM